MNIETASPVTRVQYGIDGGAPSLGRRSGNACPHFSTGPTTGRTERLTFQPWTLSPLRQMLFPDTVTALTAGSGSLFRRVYRAQVSAMPWVKVRRYECALENS